MKGHPSAAAANDLEEAALELLRDHWKIDATIERLPGENVNYLVIDPAGCKHVLKFTLDPSADVHLEEAALEAMNQAKIPVPTAVPDAKGQTIVKATIGKTVLDARLQHFLPGSPWRNKPIRATALHNIGSTLARAHHAMAALDAPQAQRSHRWDLANAQQHRDRVNLIDDRARRQWLEHCYHLHAAITQPALPNCPTGILHGDPNDENILIEGDSVAGLIDASDCLHGPLVVDLGICLAYALQQPDASLESVETLIAGYQTVRSLQPLEIELLFPLAMTRLATSICISAERKQVDAQHTTWYSHDQTTWTALERFIATDPRQAANALSPATTIDAVDIASLMQERNAHVGSALSLSYLEPLHIVRGRGQFLLADDGRPYLDLVNNVCHVGHCNPHVVEAISDQAKTLNTNTRYLHTEIVRYADRLCDTLPDELDTCFFVNSGSEANELALRIARAATSRHAVLVIDGAYHGNTGQCVAMSPYKFNGPGGPGQSDWVHVAPSPDIYRGCYRGNPTEAARAYAETLPDILAQAEADHQPVAAFFAEPILSCGGQIPLPPGYLKSAFEYVRQAGGLCVADEVQVGFGRVGESFWAFQMHDVVPDIVVMGKPIGNGHPMGAVVTTRAIAERFNNGMEFFSTFGGNPVSCACGNAVLDVIEHQGLQQRAKTLGDHFLAGLHELKTRHHLIGDVRGQGLFLGIEMVTDSTTLEPASKEARDVVNQMRQHGVLLSTDGPLHNVIKIKPPMVLESSDINMAIRLLDDALAAISLPSDARDH